MFLLSAHDRMCVVFGLTGRSDLHVACAKLHTVRTKMRRGAKRRANVPHGSSSAEDAANLLNHSDSVRKEEWSSSPLLGCLRNIYTRHSLCNEVSCCCYMFACVTLVAAKSCVGNMFCNR